MDLVGSGRPVLDFFCFCHCNQSEYGSNPRGALLLKLLFPRPFLPRVERNKSNIRQNTTIANMAMYIPIRETPRDVLGTAVGAGSNTTGAAVVVSIGSAAMDSRISGDSVTTFRLIMSIWEKMTRSFPPLTVPGANVGAVVGVGVVFGGGKRAAMPALSNIV